MTLFVSLVLCVCSCFLFLFLSLSLSLSHYVCVSWRLFAFFSHNVCVSQRALAFFPICLCAFALLMLCVSRVFSLSPSPSPPLSLPVSLSLTITACLRSISCLSHYPCLFEWVFACFRVGIFVYLCVWLCLWCRNETLLLFHELKHRPSSYSQNNSNPTKIPVS